MPSKSDHHSYPPFDMSHYSCSLKTNAHSSPRPCYVLNFFDMPCCLCVLYPSPCVWVCCIHVKVSVHAVCLYPCCLFVFVLLKWTHKVLCVHINNQGKGEKNKTTSICRHMFLCVLINKVKGEKKKTHLYFLYLVFRGLEIPYVFWRSSHSYAESFYSV